ncbi:MAG: DUF4965 domain-containing protein [Clostridia bacterium]|nr:DUF4965 domain-containing protein [Clostridia bacterium]
MQNKKLRAPCVPLITNDPMFNVWSFADKLTDDVPRHWTNERQFITGTIAVDGELFQYIGKLHPDNHRYATEFPALPQVDVTIKAMTTIYTFENEKIRLELSFMSPLLMDDLKLLSRPITYLNHKLTSLDGKSHDIQLFVGLSCEMAVNEPSQSVTFGRTALSITCSSGTDMMLKRSGDDHRIEWGTLHLIAPHWSTVAAPIESLEKHIRSLYKDRKFPKITMNYQGPGPNPKMDPPEYYKETQSATIYPHYPTLFGKTDFILEDTYEEMIAFGYDDIKSIQYFGENIEAYWRKDGDTFQDIMQKALDEYEEIKGRVEAFEEDLTAKASALSPKYADILNLAYRQTIAAHKLTWHDGEIQFFSKENYSNGCIATVDVTYPSIPLFLIYQPDLVEGMLNPIFKLIEKGLWEFDFAPHDAGQYPLANRQVYGYSNKYFFNGITAFEKQMPVEECGNMILCVAGLCYARGDFSYFKKHEKILKQWADYLLEAGYDPENQLCTDDFAGHLAHNCNLSVKAAMGIAAYAKILKDTGNEKDAAIYHEKAAEFASLWEKGAKTGDHTRLAFDQEDSWSIKYNMVWDNLLDLHIYSKQTKKDELAYYKKMIHPYGLPLDNRADYTKSDWQLWSVMLDETDEEYFNLIVDRMWDFLNETVDRIPFTDWYFTSKAFHRGFQNRTVQGGLFIKLLKF